MSAMSLMPNGTWRRTRAWCAGLLLVILGAAATPALAQGVGRPDFDHLKAGFALTGNHVQVRCESCHQNGIFKGTPRNCAACHVAGMRFSRGNVVMPQQHLPTQAACDSCHTTKTFVGAKFNHVGVAAGSC
jgi:Class III cytochrome C family